MGNRERRTDLATFEEAQALIFEVVRDSEWHSSREIHQELRERLSDPMFGRVKKELGIEHHRVGGGQGATSSGECRRAGCAGTSPVELHLALTEPWTVPKRLPSLALVTRKIPELAGVRGRLR